VNCLKPLSRLAQSEILLSKSIGNLTQDGKQWEERLKTAQAAQQAAEKKIAEEEKKHEEGGKQGVQEIARLKTIGEELTKKCEEWKTLYAKIKAQYDEAQASVKEHVVTFTQTTNALMVVNQSLTQVRSGVAAAIPHDDGALHIAVDNFKGENATMEQLLQQFQNKLIQLEAVKNEMTKLQESLVALIQRESQAEAVQQKIVKGKEELAELQRRMEELVPVLQAQASALEKAKKGQESEAGHAQGHEQQLIHV